MVDKDDAPWNATLEEKIGWCMWNIMQLRGEFKPKPSKPWYTSVMIWLVILLVILMFILIYVFYLVDKVGYGITLPQWMR